MGNFFKVILLLRFILRFKFVSKLYYDIKVVLKSFYIIRLL